MASKRIYVTPKDITMGGVWDGGGKDAISRAMTRAFGHTIRVGATLYAGYDKDKKLIVSGALPKQIREMSRRYPGTRIVGPRFNFRIQTHD